MFYLRLKKQTKISIGSRTRATGMPPRPVVEDSRQRGREPLYRGRLHSAKIKEPRDCLLDPRSISLVDGENIPRRPEEHPSTHGQTSRPRWEKLDPQYI